MARRHTAQPSTRSTPKDTVILPCNAPQLFQAPQASRLTARLATTACAGLLALVAGCVTQPKESYTSKHDVGAVWNHPRLRATLPNIEPARVIAAADMTFRDRGYFITANESTADRGRISARPNNSNMASAVTVWAEADDQGGTAVSVSAGPFGDELLSRITLDGIVERLGLAE